MSRSTDKAVEEYVSKKMPKRVKKALADAKYDLYYGPGGGGGMGWEKASQIVEDWWDENLGDDLVVDDGGNVTTKHDFDRYLEQIFDEYEKEYVDEGLEEYADLEDQDERDEKALEYAKQQAQAHVDGAIETSTLYDSGDVRRLVLGREWAR